MTDEELRRFAADNLLLLAIGRAMAPVVNEKLAELERELERSRADAPSPE